MLEKNKLRNKFAKSEYRLNSLAYNELKSKNSIQSILNNFSSEKISHGVLFSENFSLLKLGEPSPPFPALIYILI